MKENFDSFKELISEFIVLLIKFSKCKSEEVAVKSLDYLKKMITKTIQDSGAKPVDFDQNTILEESQSDHEIQPELKANSQPLMLESRNNSLFILFFFRQLDNSSHFLIYFMF